MDGIRPPTNDASPAHQGGVVFTVGYGGDTADHLVARLDAAGVTHVADVRSRPASRFRPEYNGPALQARLAQSGIGYVFLGADLGGRPDDPSCYTSDGRVDYRLIREKPFFARGLERVHSGASRHLRICLLCSEGRPESCHRTKLVAQALVEQFGVDVQHIDPDGRVIAHKDVLARVDGGQQSFGFIDLMHESVGTYTGDGAKR